MCSTTTPPTTTKTFPLLSSISLSASFILFFALTTCTTKKQRGENKTTFIQEVFLKLHMRNFESTPCTPSKMFGAVYLYHFWYYFLCHTYRDRSVNKLTWCSSTLVSLSSICTTFDDVMMGKREKWVIALYSGPLLDCILTAYGWFFSEAEVKKKRGVSLPNLQRQRENWS